MVEGHDQQRRPVHLDFEIGAVGPIGHAQPAHLERRTRAGLEGREGISRRLHDGAVRLFGKGHQLRFRAAVDAGGPVGEVRRPGQGRAAAEIGIRPLGVGEKGVAQLE